MASDQQVSAALKGALAPIGAALRKAEMKKKLKARVSASRKRNKLPDMNSVVLLDRYLSNYNALCEALGVPVHKDGIGARTAMALEVTRERNGAMAALSSLRSDAVKSLDAVRTARKVCSEVMAWHEHAAECYESMPPKTVATIVGLADTKLADAWFLMPKEVRDAARS